MNKRDYSGLIPMVFRIFMLTGTVILTTLLMSCPCPECETCPECECGKTECIDFEDPALGTSYTYLDLIEDSGSWIIVDVFQWGNGTWDDGGNATIMNTGNAMGTGQEIWTNNVNLRIEFCEPVEGLSLRYGTTGGNQNLIVNGCLENFTDFAALPATMCGVSVTATGASSGMLTLCGTITSFSIGGQELAVDDICFDACK